MKTLKDLRERVWFRFLKVVYLTLYLPFILILIVGISEYREYHPEVLPSLIFEALVDPKFQSLDVARKRELLSKIERDFALLPTSEQNKIINTKITPIHGPWEEYQSSSFKDKEYTVTDLSINKSITFIWKDQYPPTINDLGEIFKEAKKIESKKNRSADSKPPHQDIVWEDEKQERLHEGFVLDYNYSSYYTWQIKSVLVFAIVFSIVYFAIMEAIKRAFYYVVIGKVFPKE